MNDKYFETTYIFRKQPEVVEFAPLFLIGCLTNR